MNDVSKTFDAMGLNSSYAHPQADAIIDECAHMLNTIPEGQRLLDMAKNKAINIDIMTGRKIDWKVDAANRSIHMFCPANTKSVDVEEMTLGFAIALREVEHADIGIPVPKPIENPESAPNDLLKFFLDINMETYKIVSEFEAVGKAAKFLDLLKKLGQYDEYKEYVSGRSAEEMAERLKEKLNRT